MAGHDNQAARDPQKVTSTVTIYGVDYRLRAPEDPAFIRAVAEAADRRMREVAGKQHTASHAQVAVLTLLNVTGELLAEQARRRELEQALAERAGGLGDRLEAALRTHRQQRARTPEQAPAVRGSS